MCQAKLGSQSQNYSLVQENKSTQNYEKTAAKLTLAYFCSQSWSAEVTNLADVFLNVHN